MKRVPSKIQTHRHTDTQTHRHTDTQTHRHTDTQTHRHTDTQTHRHTDTQTHRHTDTQTHRHTDTQTHRHTDTQTHRHTHTQRLISGISVSCREIYNQDVPIRSINPSKQPHVIDPFSYVENDVCWMPGACAQSEGS